MLLKRIIILTLLLSLGGCEVGCGIRHVCKDRHGYYVDCRAL
jgi:hypothetical protein